MIAPRRALLAGLAAMPARAQTPRPGRMIIPYGAGNVTDQVARVVIDALAPRWGGRLVADNQPGAGGMLGAYNLSRATPDGSVFGMVAVAALAIAPHTVAQMRYDPLADLVPVAGVSVSSSFLAVNGALPVRNLAELAAYARAQPVFYYSPGNATVPHLNIAAISRALGVAMEHVPYRTSAAGNTDVLAGRIQVTMDSVSLTMPHLQSGALRPLAYNGVSRHPDFPAVPTMAEALPGLTLLNAWQGLFFPRGTPQAIIQPVADDVMAAMAAPDFAARLPPGTTPMPLDAQGLTALLRRDHARLGVLVREIGLTPD